MLFIDSTIDCRMIIDGEYLAFNIVIIVVHHAMLDEHKMYIISSIATLGLSLFDVPISSHFVLNRRKHQI